MYAATGTMHMIIDEIILDRMASDTFSLKYQGVILIPQYD
jgi:hypothetical protein